MELNIPFYINCSFIIITFLTIYLLYKAANKAKIIFWITLPWLLVQGLLAYSGFYENTTTVPPRLILMAVPAFIFIIFLFSSKKGKQFIDQLSEKQLTILHTIRIPVEIILWSLFIVKAIPELMTFEGLNFDILAGLTAPIIYYFGYLKNTLSKSVLIFWNIACILLLLNIVVVAILAIPSNFQMLAFNQPNLAILQFPMVWLPCCVVPIVFFAHFATLRHLLRK